MAWIEPKFGGGDVRLCDFPRARTHHSDWSRTNQGSPAAPSVVCVVPRKTYTTLQVTLRLA